MCAFVETYFWFSVLNLAIKMISRIIFYRQLKHPLFIKNLHTNIINRSHFQMNWFKTYLTCCRFTFSFIWFIYRNKMSINNNNEAGAGKCDIYNYFSFGGVEKKSEQRRENRWLFLLFKSNWFEARATIINVASNENSTEIFYISFSRSTIHSLAAGILSDVSL